MHQPLGPPNQKMRMAMWWKVSAPLRQRKVLSKAHFHMGLVWLDFMVNVLHLIGKYTSSHL